MTTKLIIELGIGQTIETEYFTPGRVAEVTRTSHHTFFVNGIRTVKSIVNGNGRVEVPFQELVTMTEDEILELASMQVFHPSATNTFYLPVLPF